MTALVITYNHEPFIETALESVLSQETEFDFEVIVSEDRSTDRTREIVERIAGDHPDRVRLLLSERNLNSNQVIRRGLEAAGGRYVAMLDGDDLWTAPRKLQLQAAFLDANPTCSNCFHNVNVAYEEGDRTTHPFHVAKPSGANMQPKPKPRSSVADIVRYNFVPTCSVMFRREVGQNLPSWYDGLGAGDWPLHVLAAQRGELAYLDEVMGTYRVHPGGVWSTAQSTYRHLVDVEELVRLYDTFNRHLGFSFDREISEQVSATYQSAATRFYKRGDHRNARVCARRSLRRARAGTVARRWKALAVMALSAVEHLAPVRRGARG